MKEFLKYTLATITGLAITGVMVIVFGIVLLGVMAVASSGNDNTVIEDNSVLVVKLSGKIVEHTTNDPINSVLGNTDINQQGLDEIVCAIDKASQCNNIKGIYIEAGILSADYASLQEIRKALVRFKGKDGRKAKDKPTKDIKGDEKFIVAYGDEYSQGAYYVCSAADAILMNPQGMLDLHGISSQPVYLKDLLEKVGVKMTVVKVGKYKSATERYTETKMSDASREQVTRYVGNLWNVIADDICNSRGITKEALDKTIDGMPMFQDGNTHKQKTGLIDGTMYADEVKNYMKSLLGLDKTDEISQVNCKEMCSYTPTAFDNKAPSYIGNDNAEYKIAIYYCEGSIVRNATSGMLMGDAGIVSKKMIDDLDELAEDDNVKAVVIRINSGGGDAFASENIWHSVTELDKVKPVVISMGGMAASGAYYLSAGASWIVAQPTTLTGSIGIFGCFPNMSVLMQEKLGIHYDNIKTHRNADFDLTQSARPFTEEEQKVLQSYIERGYELFCKRVADGRKLPIAKIKEIAEGRVWTGSDAIKLKLVDQLGGMPEAISKAAQLAHLKEYATEAYPTPTDWWTSVLDNVKGKDNNLDEQLRTTLGTFYEPFCMVRSLERQSPIQARCEWIMLKK